MQEKAKTQSRIRLNCDLLQYGTVLVDRIDDSSIILKTPNENEIVVDHFGKVYSGDEAACVIWPIESRDWEGFRDNNQNYPKIPEFDWKSLADYQLYKIVEEIGDILEIREEERECDRDIKLDNFKKTTKPGLILKNGIPDKSRIQYAMINSDYLEDYGGYEVYFLEINPSNKTIHSFIGDERLLNLTFCYDVVEDQEKIKGLFELITERNKKIDQLKEEAWEKYESSKL